MLFGYELKKIWRRVSPLLVLIILAVTTVATISITFLFFNHAPAETSDVSTQYNALSNKILNWSENNNRDAIATSFNQFYHDYKVMNASTLNGVNLVDNYNKAKTSFQNFYIENYQKYIYNTNKDYIADYLLVQKKYIKHFNQILEQLDAFFNAGYTDGNAIIAGLKFTNPTWEDTSLQTILDNLFFVQTIATNDLADLKKFFTTYPANQAGYDYTDAYDYALNRFWLSVATTSTYTGHLSQYEGFNDYRDLTTCTQICKLTNYRLTHPDNDYSTPFTFGNIYNQSKQISLFDFVFTNMEMAMIPLSLLVIIWTASTFFTDSYQNTLITPVASGKKRSTIIVAKMLAIIALTIIALLLLTAVYLTCGLVFFRAYINPDILFLFNGTTPTVMSAINYFALYFLNLVFKLLPLIAICGLFSFSKTKPFIIVGLTVLVYLVIIMLNFFLGNFWFYQFIPLLGLDPMRYCGAQLFLSPMPTEYNLWYTFPVIIIVDIILYLALIYKFRHHDF